MAGKKQSSSFFDSIREGIGSFADLGLNAIIGNLRSAADDFMSDAQKHVEQATIKALKAATIFILMILGVILIIVGLGTYLGATVPALANGLGHVLVGAVIMALGLLIQFFKN